MSSGMYVPHHTGRRYGVTLDSLPPIESLRPDQLKDFTKEEIKCYLEAAGVIPGLTKPEMKRQMRAILQQLHGADDKKSQALLVQPSTPPPFVPPPTAAPFISPQQQIPFPQSVDLQSTMSGPVSPRSVPSPSASSVASTDDQGELCLDCSKKANKECHYRRCRGCCLKMMQDTGLKCMPHLKDGDRRPRRNDPSFTAAIASVIATPGTQGPQNQTPNSHPTQPALNPVVTPHAHVPMAAGMPTGMASHHTQPSLPHHPAHPQYRTVPQSVRPPPPEIPKVELTPQSVAECPHCHKVVSILGANLWLHLRDCDPDHLMQYLLLHSQGKLLPEVMDKKNSEPLRKAHQNAMERFKRNIEYLQDIFSSTSVEELVDELMKQDDEERKNTIESFRKTLEHMESLFNKQDQFLEQFKQQSDKFYQHFHKLQKTHRIV
jgi:LRP1 type putative zinc finger protein